MLKEPQVSVIIPTVDRADALYNLLIQLQKQSYSYYEIVVVEQSKEIDIRILSYVDSRSHIKLLHLTKRGLPNARNEGIKNSSGDIVLFIDDDEIPDKDLILYHVKQYEKEWVSGVGGRVSGGYDSITKDERVGDFRELDGKVFRNFNSSIEKEVKHIAGGNMSFRRDIFNNIGFFDESYGGASIGEETDFCFRALRAKHRLVFEPRAYIEHLHLQTGGCRGEKFEDWLYWCFHNSVLLAMRYMGISALLMSLVKYIARILLFAVAKCSPNLILVGLKGLVSGTKTYRLSQYR